MLSEDEFFKLLSFSIKKLRMEKGLTCEKLAEMVETDYSSINQIENNKQKPKSYTLYKIFEALGLEMLSDISSRVDKRGALESRLIEKISLMNASELASLDMLIENFNILKK